MKKRVGILGGSFDPVHCGHARIANSFLQSGLIEELLVILSPYPPHKQDHELADFFHRFEMLNLAFENMDGVTVSDLEQKLEKPSYTLQTITHLQNENPDTLYFLCLGEDSLQHFDKWHNYHEILKRVDLLVTDRPGFEASKIDPEILEHAVFIEHKPYQISSTSIRESRKNFMEDLPDAVADYIDKHNLYE